PRMGKRSRSRSMATTEQPRASSLSVSAPKPAPISSTRSLPAGAASSAMRSACRSSHKKFWPKECLGRSPQRSRSALGLGNSARGVTSAGRFAGVRLRQGARVILVTDERCLVAKQDGGRRRIAVEFEPNRGPAHCCYEAQALLLGRALAERRQ